MLFDFNNKILYMRYKYKLGTIVKAKDNADSPLWRVIEIFGNCSGVRYLCECINDVDSSIKLRQDYKENDIEELK